MLTVAGPAVAKSGFPCLSDFIGNDFYYVALGIKKEKVEERRWRRGLQEETRAVLLLNRGEQDGLNVSNPCVDERCPWSGLSQQRHVTAGRTRWPWEELTLKYWKTPCSQTQWGTGGCFLFPVINIQPEISSSFLKLSDKPFRDQ